MAEETNAAPPQVKMQTLAQFIRDMSFENNVALKGLTGTEMQPEVQVGVNLDAKARSQANTFEVNAKFKVSSVNKANGDTLFLLELDYGGIFLIEGVPQEQLHPFLLIECPRLMFPYIRRIISDVTHDGGFPPLNIDNVDFLALYRQEIARRQAAAQAAVN